MKKVKVLGKIGVLLYLNNATGFKEIMLNKIPKF